MSTSGSLTCWSSSQSTWPDSYALSSVKISLVATPPAELPVDALAVAVATGQRLSGGALELDKALGGVLSDMITNAEFRGRIHEVLPVPTHGRSAPRRVILYGVGAANDLDGQRLRSAHHELIRASRTYGYKRIGLVRTEPPLGMDTLKAVVEGCVMGTFERRSRQTGPQPERREIEALVLTGFGIGREHEVVAAQENGEATNRLRHRGSGHRGVPAEAGATVLALVGKGITFDSGGISIKPAENMSRMKSDMAGAAAVLSAIDVIAARKVPLDVMAVIAATENMPGPSAQRPGDVQVSADGKTVEIVNTDAEGRLVLADALTHALRNGATHILDLATLTGAAKIAIGHAASAAVSNDDTFWALVEKAAAEAGDRVWRLPIYADYRVLLRSQIADLRNAEYGEAGTILGGMCIGEFAGGKPWTHLDIASSSWNTNAELTTVLRGPSGAGTRLCIALAELMSGAER